MKQKNVSIVERRNMETTLENDMEVTQVDDVIEMIDSDNSETNANVNQIDSGGIEISFEEVLKFRDQLLSREILSNGVNTSHKVLHLGAGYIDSMIFRYIVDIKKNGLVDNLTLSYTAVDTEPIKINQISQINSEENTHLDVRLIADTAQSFLDSNTDEFDWTLITGLFNKNLYGDKQFEFLDKIIMESLKFSREGVIFTFDSSNENDENYSISNIINYVTSVYNRYRISRLNEENSVICIYKYYHSIIPQ
jgi:hypothetical protein